MRFDGSWRIRLRRTGLYAADQEGWRPHEAALRLKRGKGVFALR